MTSPHPAPLSPLAFTLAYQQYRSEASRIPFADTRLLKAAQFWRANAAVLDNPAYVTYRLEDIPPLLAALNPDQLDDVRPTELEEVAEFVERAGPIVIPSPAETPLSPDPANSVVGIPTASAAIWEHAARQWLYVGELSRAVAALERSGHSASIASDELASILADCDTHDTTEIPGIVASRVESSHPALARWLRDFDAVWTAQRVSGDANRALCLLVEYDANGSPVRGRLRRLEGKVDALKRDADSDEVTFHHQVKSPDDPFVGTVYAAFDVLRRIDNRRAATVSTGPRYRGRFTFERDSGETYSGDSIGLSAFAVAYGDQWGREVHRERRLIGQTVTFTGGIGPDGSVQPISPDSLPLKVERAFHSPITHLIVPEANRKAAEAEAGLLRQAHPHRRLHIIGVERPSDIIADHNIFHTEKLWPGEFAIRKAAKYSRSVKVHVPVLVVLGYLLLCLIEPRAWPLFDRNPQYLHLRTDGFDILNADHTRIGSKTFPCECDTVESRWTVGDLDKDSRNEFAYILKAVETSPCSLNAVLFVYDDDNRRLFDRSCVILGEYPGDTSLQKPYRPGYVDFIDLGDSAIVRTGVTISNMARTHMKFWSRTGDQVGWYINQGFGGDPPGRIYSQGRDGLWLAAYNNRMKNSAGKAGQALFKLRPTGSRGVSPPYLPTPDGDVSKCQRGNQLQYIVFPPTDVVDVSVIPYAGIRGIVPEPDGGLHVAIAHGGPPHDAEVWYYVNREGRVWSLQEDDYFWPVRDSLVAEGKLPQVDHDRYRQSLLESVMYWTDSGWVTEGRLRRATSSPQ